MKKDGKARDRVLPARQLPDFLSTGDYAFWISQGRQYLRWRGTAADIHIGLPHPVPESTSTKTERTAGTEDDATLFRRDWAENAFPRRRIPRSANVWAWQHYASAATSR